MKIRIWLSMAGLLLWTCYVHAGIELRSVPIKTSDGLPCNSVRYMLQDSKGFVWLGTLNGLSRYDGNSFQNFLPELDKSKLSLADNRISGLAEDRNGFLWISSMPELFSCYDLQNECFVDFTGEGYAKQKYSSIYLAKNGDVWLYGSRGGCMRVVCQVSDGGRQRTLKAIKYKTEAGNLPDNHVSFITEDASGCIWVGTKRGLMSVAGGQYNIVSRHYPFFASQAYGADMHFVTDNGDIYRYATASGQLARVAVVPESAGETTVTGQLPLADRWLIFTFEGVYTYDFKGQRMTKDPDWDLKRGEVLQDNYGDYWIYNHSGRVYYVSSDGKRVRDFCLIPEDKISYIDHERYHVVRDARGIVWISTYGNGLFAYDLSSDTLQHFTSNSDETGLVNSDYLMFLMEDRSGSIWVSAEFAGLSRISVLNEGARRIFPEASTRFDRSNTIRMLTRTPDGNVWAGSRMGGLYSYDTRLKQKKSAEYFTSNVYAVALDADGRRWLGTRGEGVKIGDTWYRTDPSDPSALSHNHIFSIYRDKKDRMWIATFGGGLELAERQPDGSYRFRHFYDLRYGLRLIRRMAEDDKGMMWVGTNEGVCVFHPDSLLANGIGSCRLFSYTNGKFCSNEIKYMYCDRKGRMWVGTSGAGLNLCWLEDDGETLQYEHYGTEQGLANDVVQAILDDDEGQIWVATEYGISKFNPEKRSFENYFFSRYTLADVYGESSACLGSEGRLLFGTNHGLVVIDPRKTQEDEKFYPIVFTDLYINGDHMTPGHANSPLEASLAYSESIRLDYFQNSFRVDFATFDYADGGRTKYMHYLENYDTEWSAPTASNSATYKYLKPGTYVLHVKACNRVGAWSGEEARLEIVIAPPFWQTAWAMAIYLIIIGVILYFAYRLTRNFNNLRNRVRVEKQLTEYKLRFFTNISHEFRTPLTLIQGAMEKIQQVEEVPHDLIRPLRTMDKSVQRMMRLVNQLLEFRKMQNNKLALALEETDVIAFFRDIYQNFEDAAAQKDMAFTYVASPESYRMFIDKSYLDKVAYNLLSNSFKYTPSHGTITFTVQVDEAAGMLLLQVEDTGVGIPREKQNELFKRFMQSSFSNDSIGVGLHLTHELVSVHKGTIEYKDRAGGGSVFTVRIPTDKGVYEAKDFLIADNVLLKEAEAHTHVHFEEAVTPAETHITDEEKQPEAPAEIPEASPVSVEPSAESVEEEANIQEPTDTTRPYCVDDTVELEAVTTGHSRRRIVVIEDDNDIRQFLEEELSAYFDIKTAADGKSGCKTVASFGPDLVISDVMMPVMNGYEVTKRLKSDFTTSHIPIILLTALNTSDKQMKGVEAGADAYISKPFSLKLLLMQIYRLIEQRERLREKFSNEAALDEGAEVYNNEQDKVFMERLMKVMDRNMSRFDFTVDELAQQMDMGRTSFYRRLRDMTGYSPNEWMRIMRLKKAAELLLTDDEATVADIGWKVGFSDSCYFSKCFKVQFGIAPTAYKISWRKGTKKADEPEAHVDDDTLASEPLE